MSVPAPAAAFKKLRRSMLLRARPGLYPNASAPTRPRLPRHAPPSAFAEDRLRRGTQYAPRVQWKSCPREGGELLVRWLLDHPLPAFAGTSFADDDIMWWVNVIENCSSAEKSPSASAGRGAAVLRRPRSVMI